MIGGLIALFGPAISGNVALAQVTEEWVARYNGPGTIYFDDSASALAVDAAGNVYITGASIGSDNAYDYATIKYDTHGNPLWVARYDGPGNSLDTATAIAVDAVGNVYVTGNSVGSGTNYDYATIKYDTNGNQLWVARYDGPGNGSEYANALVVDAAGNVYVTGFSTGIGTDSDYATIKYDANGNQVWVARYNGPGNYEDIAHALAVDSAGNVYATGSSSDDAPQPPVFSYHTAYATIKYDMNGNPLWTARYYGPENFDIAFALALDAAGNVYVTGSSADPATFSDYATIKYDTNGNQLWAARYNGPANSDDHANSLALDSASNVYVTGMSDGGLATGDDYATIKYDTNGNPLWAARYNGPANSTDHAQALALDSAGNVFVTGSSVVSPIQDDYATIKYDTNGNPLWIAQYNGPANSNDDAATLAVDAVGNVYVTGQSFGSGTSLDYTTVKYSQAKLVNISTRAMVLTGNNVTIGGFYIGGTTPKAVLIRARGHSMSGPPFYVSGTLGDPMVQLYAGSTVIAQNDNWLTTDPLCGSPAVSCGNVSQIIDTGLDPCRPNPGQILMPQGCYDESVILITLPPGGYTAIMSGAGGTTGVGLIEAFELDTGIQARLVNISTRAMVLTGDKVTIGGFYITGTTSKTVLVRARGPSMGGAPFNVPGTLSNPVVQLYSGSSVIAQNNDWQTTDPLCGSPAVLCGNASQIMATGLDPCQPNPGETVAPPGCAQESAILITLPPGGYTAIMSGVSGTTGVGLIEVFEEN